MAELRGKDPLGAIFVREGEAGMLCARQHAALFLQGGMNVMGKDVGQAKGEARACFGGGCFWCVEAVFQNLRGVKAVLSGYAGGHDPHPSYERVCRGNTGHAEVCMITYDPAVVSYETLLEVFFRTHDPTTSNRQGNDIGTQYRSIILYQDEEQRQAAEAAVRALTDAGVYAAPIVTEIVPLLQFHPAEQVHHDYYQKHPEQAYCAAVIGPKLEKMRAAFAALLAKAP